MPHRCASEALNKSRSMMSVTTPMVKFPTYTSRCFLFDSADVLLLSACAACDPEGLAVFAQQRSSRYTPHSGVNLLGQPPYLLLHELLLCEQLLLQLLLLQRHEGCLLRLHRVPACWLAVVHHSAADADEHVGQLSKQPMQSQVVRCTASRPLSPAAWHHQAHH